MKITNKYNLPETIVNVVKRPTYSKGDANISATELLTSPRIVQLRAKHMAEIEVDVSEVVWSLFGSAIHNILEHGKSENHVVEERLFANIEGWNISGAVDLQEVRPDGSVDVKDYKVTSVWAVMNEKEDWRNQLNIYAWLVETIKKTPVHSLQIVAICRDWSAWEASTKENYPPAPITTVDIPLWSAQDQENFVLERLHKHNEAYFAAKMGEELPHCTDDEMWAKPTTYAVKKVDGVRAKRVLETRQEAEELLATLKDHVIEVREGERTRCERYCQVSQFCDQYQTYKATKGTP